MFQDAAGRRPERRPRRPGARCPPQVPGTCWWPRKKSNPRRPSTPAFGGKVWPKSGNPWRSCSRVTILSSVIRGTSSTPLRALNSFHLCGELFNAEVRQKGSSFFSVVSRAGVVLAQKAYFVHPAKRVSKGSKATLAKLTVIGNQLFHQTPPPPDGLGQKPEF